MVITYYQGFAKITHAHRLPKVHNIIRVYFIISKSIILHIK